MRYVSLSETEINDFNLCINTQDRPDHVSVIRNIILHVKTYALHNQGRVNVTR